MRATRTKRANRKMSARKAAEKSSAGTSVPLHLRVRNQLAWLVPTIILAIFGTTFAVQAFEIPSSSMEDTLLIGERVLADRVRFAEGAQKSSWLPYREIRRGDIVIFKYPPDPNVPYVKRVIGLPGDRIRLVKKQLQRNGQLVDEPYVVHKDARFDDYRDNFPAGPLPSTPSPDFNPAWLRALPDYVHDGWLTVPAGCYFVMGDNRDLSLDSRFWGFVPADHILGSPLFVYWSLESTAADFQASSQLEWAGNFVKRIILFPFRARWRRMFLPAGMFLAADSRVPDSCIPARPVRPAMPASATRATGGRLSAGAV